MGDVATQGSLFRYFQLPHSFSTYRRDPPHSCDLCGRVRPGYAGPFYGQGNEDFVCEECLIAGRLAERGMTTNTGDAVALREQLAVLSPESESERLEELVRERTAELEERTPHIVSWQDWAWPAHCGDYARFEGEVGQPDLIQLAPDGDGRRFFLDHLYDFREGTDPGTWETIRPDSPTDMAISYSTAVYLFRCLHCGEHLRVWDCD